MARFWGLFAALVFWGSSAAADQIPGTQTNVAGWTLAAYTNNKTGRFSHCAMSAGYRSGISLIFSISQNYSWRVAWTSEAWRLQKGQKVELSLFVDGGAPYSLTAVAFDQNMAMAELPDSASLFDMLRKGYRLTVWAQGNRYDFNLDGTYAALTEAHACVARIGAPPAPKAPPPLVSAPMKPADQPSKTQITTEQQLEATTLVANLLAQGDLSGFRILTAKERQDDALKGLSDWNVLWRSDTVAGVLKIIPKAAGINPGAITAFLLGDDAKTCGDDQFASGTLKDDKSPNISRLFTACKGDANNWTTRYIVVPREEGGYYLFGTLAVGKKNGSDGKIEDVDGLLRASVFNVLKR